MIVLKLFVFYSVLINLSQALSNNCTPETPWFCEGGTDIKFEDDTVNNLLAGQGYVGRIYRPEDYDYHLIIMKHQKQEVPENFDAREHWPECKSISRIKNQASCGSCWAVVGGTVATDRLCISSKGKNLFEFSAQNLITCCDCYPNITGNRCEMGANGILSLIYLIADGAVSEECQPYNLSTIEQPCKTHCISETTPYKKVKIPFYSIGKISLNSSEKTSTFEEIQTEIMKNGPVITSIRSISVNFPYSYKNEVYVSSGRIVKDTGHAVRVLGWGTENGVPYWLCANTWGEKWGQLGGFFKIRRGTNEFGMENYMYAPIMDVRAKTVRSEDNDDKNKKIKDRIRQGHSRGIIHTTLQIYRIIVFVLVALSL